MRAEELGVREVPRLFNVGGSTTLALLCEAGRSGALGRVNDVSSGWVMRRVVATPPFPRPSPP
jgi:hypothetical protein